MAESRLRVIVETQDRELTKLQGDLKKTDKAVEDLNGANKKLERSFRGVDGAAGKAANGISKTGRAARGAAKAVGGLRSAILGLGVGFAVKKAFGDASDLESAETRLTSLTRKYKQFGNIQGAAQKSAEKFRISQVQAAKDFADLGNRLGSTGASLTDIQNVYDGFNTLLVNNKVGAQQAASAQLQLNQALGSGRLAGEEYNAISEATPGLLDEIAKVLGVQRAELKKLASEGKISSQVLIQALTNIKTQGADQLEESFGGAFGASRDFEKALSDLSTAIGQELVPAIIPLLKFATQLLKLFGKLPKPARTVAVAITAVGTAAFFAAPALKALFGVLSGITASGVLAAGPWFALAAGISAAAFALNNYQLTPKGAPTSDNLKRRGAELLKIDKQLAAAEARRDRQTDKRARESAQATVNNFQDIRQRKLKEIRLIRKELPFKGTAPTAPELDPKDFEFNVPDVDLGGGSSGGGAAVDKTNQLLEQQNEAYNNIRQSQLRLITLNGNITELDKILLQNKFDYQDAVENINKTVAAGQRAELVGYEKLIQADKDRLATKEALEQDLANADAFGKIVQGVKPLNEELTQTQELLKGSFEIVSGELQNSIKGLIDGTQEWNDVLSNVLNSLSSLLLNFAFKGLGSSLDIPGFANGGRPKPNQLSIVGEKGPELFVPDSAGTVIPNGAFGAGSAMGGGDSTVVNITINNEGNGSRSSSGSDAQEAARLGKLVERATLAVINREKRPGGTLRS